MLAKLDSIRLHKNVVLKKSTEDCEYFKPFMYRYYLLWRSVFEAHLPET
jgi:hypothetical protein